MKTEKVIVVITSAPRWSCFQYFLLGFYLLEKRGNIELKFDCDWLLRLSTILPGYHYIGAILRRLNRKFVTDSYNLEGYVLYKGNKKLFCIDSADAPYLLDEKLLNSVDVYFKMQCPIKIDPSGFSLTHSIKITYCDHKSIQYSEKRKEK